MSSRSSRLSRLRWALPPLALFLCHCFQPATQSEQAPKAAQLPTPARAHDNASSATDRAASSAPIVLAPIAAPAPHPFGARDLLAMDRVGAPELTPDHSLAVFTLRQTDLTHNRGRSDLWALPLVGGAPRRLTEDPETDDNPQIAPDGATVYFRSSRGGSSQIWRMPIGGGPATQITSLPLPISTFKLSPTGEHLAVALEVFIECEDLACTTKRLDERKQQQASGTLYEGLPVRHWDTWTDGRRSHLFVVPVAGGDAPIDVSKGLDGDVPSKPFGGAEEFAFSRDGRNLVFSAKVEPTGSETWSTNFDLYASPIDGAQPPRNLTQDNPATDTAPVFSGDGKILVWKAMDRPGFESDRFHLATMAWPDGPTKRVAATWDRSVGEIITTEDAAKIYVTAEDLGTRALWEIDTTTEQPRKLTQEGSVSAPAWAGDHVVALLDDLRHPAELVRIATEDGAVQALTTINADKIEAAHTGQTHQFHFVGAGGDTVYGWLVEPVDRDPSKKYPVAFLIHGGPQGSFGDHFHYRWNPQVYAGAGYAAIMIDFHGSTGYGQAFTDAIRNAWGSRPLEDLQKGLTAVLKQYPWLDGDRVCALGASYGGFMINWIAGHWPDRFRCLVNHDGLFDQRSMYYSTEELWFPEWEFGGPQFDRAKQYEQWSPVNAVSQWKTPMLVIHGAMDFRVPETQGLATYTALVRRGIPSQLLWFPDENHWVLKPANTLQWHDTVLAWLNRYTTPQGATHP